MKTWFGRFLIRLVEVIATAAIVLLIPFAVKYLLQMLSALFTFLFIQMTKFVEVIEGNMIQIVIVIVLAVVVTFIAAHLIKKGEKK